MSKDLVRECTEQMTIVIRIEGESVEVEEMSEGVIDRKEITCKSESVIKERLGSMR